MDGPAVGDGGHPRGDRTAGLVEAGRQPPKFDEHLLGHFLGLRRIANDLQHDTVHERRERIVELGEGSLIAPAGDAGARWSAGPR